LELKDLIVTPIVLLLVYFLAYLIRPRVTDANTKRYFIPALTVKIIGAIAVGLVYQFYYGGGDTFAYHTHGSRVIWEAFMESPATGVKLFLNADITDGVYKYAHKIWYYNDPKSFFVIQIATAFDLITFGTYSATAILFAVFGFSGVWALYLIFYNKVQNLHFGLALAVLFVPTVFFWGSGILKDTISLSCLGWMAYSFDRSAINGKMNLLYLAIFVVAGWMLYSLKIYILMSFLPSLILWFYLSKVRMVKHLVVRLLVAPVLLIVVVSLGYFAVMKVTEDNPKYRLDRLAQTAKVTAYDIRFGWGARYGEGSGYYLGELDGSFTSLVKLMPAAINVSLFRPYLWEVQNPLMLLSALESMGFLLLTIYLFVKVRTTKIIRFLLKPEVAFCITFSLIFAFAVGISTYNFGTLSRYKMPLIPFYLTALIIIYNYSNKDKKSSELAFTE